ncbi:MAG TPA: branched-chain amino acid ABC transporter permease [Chloroflexota bacterium]|nr:branched-chain amino acid ABC transporter permease [Chloroflexota bacterium]
MSTFLTLTIAGISLAALYFMVSAGLSLIFGLMGVLNFAHGAFFLWGAYVWYQVFSQTGNFWVALLAALAAGAAIGGIVEVIFIRPIYQRPLSQILVTLGLALVLTQLVIAVWGVNAEYPADIPGLSRTLYLGSFYVPSYDFFIIGSGLVVLILVWSLLRFTRIGLIVRAGVENPTMVSALGINVRLVFLGVFSLGSALAALGGAIYTPYVHQATPDMGQSILLSAIIVVVLGGLGSYLGSALGALIIGLAQNYVPYYTAQIHGLETVSASAASLISLVILVVILLLRPQGLMGIKLEGGL